jgi:hypothetical protein
VLGSVQLPDKGRYTILGSPPIPRINGAQLKDVSIIYHHPPAKPNRRKKVEGGSLRKYETSPRRGKLTGGESEITGRIHDAM